MRQPCQTHDAPDGARYCIQCGAAVAAEGRTERLGKRLVLGYLDGEPIFEYSKDVWENDRFMVCSPFLDEVWL